MLKDPGNAVGSGRAAPTVDDRIPKPASFLVSHRLRASSDVKHRPTWSLNVGPRRNITVPGLNAGRCKVWPSIWVKPVEGQNARKGQVPPASSQAST